MILPRADAQQYFKLFHSLLAYVNSQKNILRNVRTPEDIGKLPGEKAVKVRNELYQDIGMIDSFVQKNPHKFSREELEILSSWKNYLQGDFYLLRHLKRYSIVMTTSSSVPIAYGVLSLKDDLKDLVPYVPIPV